MPEVDYPVDSGLPVRPDDVVVVELDPGVLVR
jgi:hypothetical protein